MKKLTLEDIGKLAGVSRSTVSRVINNYPHISLDIRERVEQVIKETGYQPNSAARSLASNRTNVIGVIIPSVMQLVFSDPYFLIVLQGISKACNSNNYILALFLFHSVEEEQSMLQRVLHTHTVDGIIITADDYQETFVASLLESTMPFVLIGRSRKHENINYVDVDNSVGSYMATNHLIRQGYKRIALIGNIKNVAARDRNEGYRRALSERGYPINEDLIVLGTGFDEMTGYEGMKRLLLYEPDAVFATSDAMALGALRAIQEAGKCVPADIALVGFDDLPRAATAVPPLTTVRQPIHHLGMMAVETLIDIIQNSPDPTRRIVLPTELVIRASCGADTGYPQGV